MNRELRQRRKRERRERRRAPRAIGQRSDPWGRLARFNQQLDRWADAWSQGDTRPITLYHYTKWEAFESICRSAKFRCTAHDGTNDLNELTSADAAVIDVAKSLHRKAGPCARRLLERFLDDFERAKLASHVPVYLACFTEARDEEALWSAGYGDGGRGVCVGIHSLTTEAMGDDDTDNVARAFVKVTYDPARFVDRLAAECEKICLKYERLVSGSPQLESEAMRWTWNAMFRRVAVEAARTKKPSWAVEKEWRAIIIPKPEIDDLIVMSSRMPDGRVRRQIDVPMRPQGKPIVFDEVIIGPKQEFEAGRHRVLEILRRAGYGEGGLDLPRITGSNALLQTPLEVAL